MKAGRLKPFVCNGNKAIRHIKLVLSSACLIYSTLNSTDRIMHWLAWAQWTVRDSERPRWVRSHQKHRSQSKKDSSPLIRMCCLQRPQGERRLYSHLRDARFNHSLVVLASEQSCWACWGALVKVIENSVSLLLLLPRYFRLIGADNRPIKTLLVYSSGEKYNTVQIFLLLHYNSKINSHFLHINLFNFAFIL